MTLKNIVRLAEQDNLALNALNRRYLASTKYNAVVGARQLYCLQLWTGICGALIIPSVVAGIVFDSILVFCIGLLALLAATVLKALSSSLNYRHVRRFIKGISALERYADMPLSSLSSHTDGVWNLRNEYGGFAGTGELERLATVGLGFDAMRVAKTQSITWQIKKARKERVNFGETLSIIGAMLPVSTDSGSYFPKK